MYLLFHVLIACHVLTGAVGLVSFWAPVLSRKGSRFHVKWGKVFVYALLATGSFAVLMATCTLLAPRETHPHIADLRLIEGIFGWMMLYLGILTVNLAWYGRLAVSNRREHRANRSRLNLALQWLLLLASIACATFGALEDLWLMVGMSVVGFATVATNARFLFREEPPREAWQREHIKALIGAGISVYTAFLAFGAVRLAPQLALHPVLWSIPLVTGISLILYFWSTVPARALPTAEGSPRPPAAPRSSR